MHSIKSSHLGPIDCTILNQIENQSLRIYIHLLNKTICEMHLHVLKQAMHVLNGGPYLKT